MQSLISRLLTYSRFVKIEHTLFSLPMVYSGVLLAKPVGVPWYNFLFILTAATGARITALALNRLIDQRLDRLNLRTVVRELPAKRMSIPEAWLVTIMGILIYTVSAGVLGKLCLWLSPIPLAIFSLYPYLKRFTVLSHFGVGLGLSMAPLGGWFAIRQTFQELMAPIVLGLFTFFWVAGFDIIYATADEEFDRQHNLFSLPARLGQQKALLISAVIHTLAFGCLVVLYFVALRSGVALLLLFACGALLFWEHKKTADIELAFFKINAVLGFAVLLFVGLGMVGI